MSTFTATQFDASSALNYQKIRTNAKNGKNVRSKFKIQTPRMPLAFDLSSNTYDDRTKYDISLSFKGEDESEKVQRFHETMVSIDTYNIDWATKNSVELFGEDLTKKRDLVEDRYNCLVKMGKKVEYAPTMRVKMQTAMDSYKPEFMLFDQDRKEIEIYDAGADSLTMGFLTRGVDVVCLLEYTGLWVVGKKFGCNWKLSQAKVYTTVIERGYALQDSDEDSDEDAVSVAGEVPQQDPSDMEDTPAAEDLEQSLLESES